MSKHLSKTYMDWYATEQLLDFDGLVTEPHQSTAGSQLCQRAVHMSFPVREKEM
jgi:hypothetical protein